MKDAAECQLAMTERGCERVAPLAEGGGTADVSMNDSEYDESFDEADVEAAANKGNWLGVLESVEFVLARGGPKAAMNVAAAALNVEIQTKGPFVDDQRHLLIVMARVVVAKKVIFKTTKEHYTSARVARREAYAAILGHLVDTIITKVLSCGRASGAGKDKGKGRILEEFVAERKGALGRAALLSSFSERCKALGMSEQLAHGSAPSGS